jgi:hypothetical protein
MMPPQKPKLDPRNVEELGLYSTDDLRHLYHTAEGGDVLIRLRDGIITRTEIRAVILRRVWWERVGNYLLLIGAFAAVIAAFEGWHGWHW